MNEHFVRQWHKSIPPKAVHEKFGVYSGSWSTQMDRYWESNDGLTVSSRQIRTDWGVVEHVAISRMNGDTRDLPWAIKQQIKDELFGSRRVAVEVFPSRKNLVDVCDVYHLWVLPKDFSLPFGIHPTRDPQGKPVERGYDFSIEETVAWTESEERKQLEAGSGSFDDKLTGLLEMAKTADAIACGKLPSATFDDIFGNDDQ